MSLFEVRGLSVKVEEGHLWQRHSKTLLHNVSFAVSEGESVAYLGPNGAGKTTTFRAICGLAAGVKGEFFWQKKAVQFGDLHARLGFLPEAAYYYRSLTPRELLLGLAGLSGLRRSTLVPRLVHWAERLNFESILDQPMRYCSKGQLQRISLAQALMHEPQLLILDEPMSGLDPLGRDLILANLQEINAKGTSLLFSSHILSDAERLCHRVVALNQGKIIYDGSLNGLLPQTGRWRIRARSSLTAFLRPEVTHLVEADGCHILEGTQGSEEFNTILNAVSATQSADIVEAGMINRTLEDAFISLVNQ